MGVNSVVKVHCRRGPDELNRTLSETLSSLVNWPDADPHIRWWVRGRVLLTLSYLIPDSN
ncbi:hypothetical protein [Fervidicola ferrireducens]|uniref:hypothetical protein n=1 Tax=Fervidicola ferrireducens TaxID=520764 RepID=UPI0012ED435D|nr:hypothetical protein [Fervidicola ferrireducens]